MLIAVQVMGFNTYNDVGCSPNQTYMQNTMRSFASKGFGDLGYKYFQMVRSPYFKAGDELLIQPPGLRLARPSKTIERFHHIRCQRLPRRHFAIEQARKQPWIPVEHVHRSGRLLLRYADSTEAWIVGIREARCDAACWVERGLYEGMSATDIE